MPSNIWPSASRSHCSRPTAASRTSAAARSRTSAVGSSSRVGKIARLGDVVGRALVGDRERREPVDLVAPEVDAHRVVVGRRVHVDDRAAHRDLAPRLDLVLAPVARGDEPLDAARRGRPGRPAARRPARLLDVRAEPLHQRPHRRDDDRGGVSPAAEPPHHAEAAAHRLERRRHPLERQRLPRREQLDLVRRRGTAPRSWASRSASAPVGTASRSGRRVVTPASAATNSARAASGTATVGCRPIDRAQRRLLGEERGEAGEGWRWRSRSRARERPGCTAHPGVRCVSVPRRRFIQCRSTSGSRPSRDMIGGDVS